MNLNKIIKSILFTLLGVLFSSQAVADSSESLREQNPFYIAGQIGISSLGPIAVKTGWRSARWGIEAQYSTVTSNECSVLRCNFLGDLTDIVTRTTNNYSLDVKYFVSNSFYVGTGATYQQVLRINRTATYCDGPFLKETCHDYVETGRRSYDTISGFVFIGNQWEISHVTLGVDWFGIGAPIHGLYINESSEGAKAPTKSTDSTYDFYLLRLYAGISL